MFSFFDGASAPVMAAVVAFVACFCIARLAHARQGVAFAFAFTPLLALLAIGVATGA